MASLTTKTLALCALFGTSACEDMTLVNEPLPPIEAGQPTSAPRRDAGSSSTGSTRDAGKPAAPSNPKPDDTDTDNDPDQTSGGETDSGTSSEPSDETDGGTTPVDGEPMTPSQNKIAGSAEAAKCSSYGLPASGMCGGYYCGITIEDIRAELKPGSLCDPDPEKICDGGLTREVGKCARETKSNPVNAFDTEEQIRMKVQACVLKNTKFADTNVECLGCFLDAAQCASDNCLTQCLTGDSATCDKCRMDAECNQTVPTCAGFPSPF